LVGWAIDALHASLENLADISEPSGLH